MQAIRISKTDGSEPKTLSASNGPYATNVLHSKMLGIVRKNGLPLTVSGVFEAEQVDIVVDLNRLSIGDLLKGWGLPAGPQRTQKAGNHAALVSLQAETLSEPPPIPTVRRGRPTKQEQPID